VINNVLALASVPIMSEGGPHYRDYGMGRPRHADPAAGNIKHGGLFETAFGITRRTVDDIGGTRSGRSGAVQSVARLGPIS
jgi:formate dehydrogenase iron-sulfur subunit